MILRSLLAAVLFPSFLCCSLYTHAQPVNQTGFEAFSDETVFSRSSWQSQGFTVPWVNGFDKNRAHVDNAFAHGGTKSLRIVFPAGSFGPTNNGAQAPLQVPPRTQYYISYWLRFSDNFDWGGSSEGGKLPGLAGGGSCSGCSSCTGTNGFSARLMWRKGGKAVLYLYHMDKVNSCGDDLALQVTPGTDFIFQKGRWYQIVERVKINTGTNHNGEVEIWIDQKKALLKTGIQFVSNGDGVDNLYFSTFHGGSDASWSPSVTCHIWFDDIVITTNPSDIFTTTVVEQESKDFFFSLYPNPATGYLTLDFNQIIPEKVNIEIFNLAGERVYEAQPVVHGTYEANVSHLPSGLYILSLSSGERIEQKKIVINCNQ